MRRIALCLPADLEPLRFTKVMLKIPFSGGFSSSSARGKWDTGRASLGSGMTQESICNSPGQHLLLPGALRSGVSGGTSQCQ